MMTTAPDDERPRARDRGHVRRLPGLGEGDVQPSRLPRPRAPVRRQLDQLGAHRGAGRSITSPRRWRWARRIARSPSRCRPAISATSSPAMSPRAWACRSTGWWSPPTSTTSWCARLRPATTRLRDVVPTSFAVDGHPGLLEFRAPAVRRLWPRRQGGPRADGLARAIAPLFHRRARAQANARAVHRRPRRRAGERGRNARLDARGRITASIRTPPSRSPSPKRKRATRRCRWWCSPPRTRRSSRKRSRPPAASRPSCPTGSPIWQRARNASPCSASIRRRSNAIVASASRAAREGAAA